jgi:photosystem II stability/assembly factor-like uncharacterized protein
VILISDDGGVSWRQAKVPVSLSLTQVSFATPQLGWAVGHAGVVLISSDGGETWTKQLDGVKAAALMLASVKSTGVPNNEAAKALLADAERLVADGADKPWLDALFDAQRGIVVGSYGMALASIDGGKSWQSWTERIPNPKGRHLYGVAAIGERIVLAGEQGSVFSSSDGGHSFRAHATPYGGTFFGVVMLDTERWLVYGLLGNALLSTDAGSTWTAVESADAAQASFTSGLGLSDGSVVLGTGNGKVLRSTDRGRSFKQLGATQPGPVLGMVALADGGLVLTGLRGATRLAGIQNASTK